jgi:hypothetical protein
VAGRFSRSGLFAVALSLDAMPGRPCIRDRRQAVLAVIGF